MDKKRILNYVQWKSKDGFKAMPKNEDMKKHIEEVEEPPENFDASTYNVVWKKA